MEKQGLDGTGWFTNDPAEIQSYGGKWVTTDYKAGDIICFT